MRALAEALDCAPTAVYRYFLNKDEIVLALKAVAVAEMTGDGSTIPDTDNPLADLRAIYWRYYRFSKTHPVHFRLLWADASTPPYDPSRAEFQGLFQLGEDARHKTRRCIEAELLPRGTNEGELMGALWCAVHGAATFRIAGVMAGMDFDRLAARGLDLVIAGARHRVASASPAVGTRGSTPPLR